MKTDTETVSETLDTNSIYISQIARENLQSVQMTDDGHLTINMEQGATLLVFIYTTLMRHHITQFSKATIIHLPRSLPTENGAGFITEQELSQRHLACVREKRNPRMD